ncbi:probable RNA-binding protein 18 [Amphiura filiformis]|uniref:probable RNA-binding protein 18 n=1 Tax=Amphiura filiformis TaxID=82378 RepID=UPI003B213DEA
MDDSDRRRLWIGNLDERITEFNLLKILRRYGDIAQFDFLFHKTGPNQGKPRGYCFVSYKTKEEAEHAMHSLDGKMALSKKLFVKWAHSQQQGFDSTVSTTEGDSSISMKADKLPSSFGGHQSQPGSSNTKKTAAQQSTQAKIRAIEAKLKQMERSGEDFNVVPVYKQRTNNASSGGKSKGKHDNSRHKPYNKR